MIFLFISIVTTHPNLSGPFYAKKIEIAPLKRRRRLTRLFDRPSDGQRDCPRTHSDFIIAKLFANTTSNDLKLKVIHELSTSCELWCRASGRHHF
jgi:hypothetical protein